MSVKKTDLACIYSVYHLSVSFLTDGVFNNFDKGGRL